MDEKIVSDGEESNIKNFYYRQLSEMFKDNDVLQRQVLELNSSLRNETIHCEEQRICIQALKNIIEEKHGGFPIRKSGGDVVIFEEDSEKNYQSTGSVIFEENDLQLGVGNGDKRQGEDMGRFYANDHGQGVGKAKGMCNDGNINIMDLKNGQNYGGPGGGKWENSATKRVNFMANSYGDGWQPPHGQFGDSTTYREYKVEFSSKYNQNEPLESTNKMHGGSTGHRTGENFRRPMADRGKTTCIVNSNKKIHISADFDKNGTTINFDDGSASKNKENCDNSSIKPNQLMSTGKLINITPQKYNSKIPFNSHVTQMSNTDILRDKLNEWLPKKWVNKDYESRAATIDS